VGIGEKIEKIREEKEKSMNFAKLKPCIEKKNVLIVGGGPDASLLSPEEYEKYDVIIRLNNFKCANECKRTDFWFSYFGNNIKDLEKRIEEEGIKGLICKYPKDYSEFVWVHSLRKELWEKIVPPVFIPSIQESFQTNNPFKISPTVGLSAIYMMFALSPKTLTIVGFDFFSSGKHNFNEAWDGSGGHDVQKEHMIVNHLVEEGFLNWVK
jgi:hypothetical protein